MSKVVEPKINDFVIEIATVNGSGSQSSNNILVKSLFRMGIPVSGKNLFPSNIQGLPTWFSIRANPQGFVSRQPSIDIFLAMNTNSIENDFAKMKMNSVFIFNADLKFDREVLNSASDRNIITHEISFRKLVKEIESSPKLKKLLTNMCYVGIIANWLKIDKTVLIQTITDFFKGKESVIEVNLSAIEIGWNYAENNVIENFPAEAQKMNANSDQILIDGNSAAALGLADGGATFAAWYPITPSSSLVEKFISYTSARDKEECHSAVVQAEDELASICMVTGAGWAGARSFTATSGPGMSLMAECAGLCYFAEIPAVIWNVQRVGPSTGLPTRTMQGDLLSAYRLSHGDTENLVLIPGNIKECFDFGRLSLDLAEKVQTLVIVLSDLDLGMNSHRAQRLTCSEKDFDRGKVLSAAELEKIEFARYRDTDGDGICYRTIAGTKSDKAAYFTRGTGHDEKSSYSEDPQVYRETVDRLKKKFTTAQRWTPKPEIKISESKTGLIHFGSSSQIDEELLFLMGQISICRIRSLPLHDEIKDFVLDHDKVFLVEQNRDCQMYQLLLAKWPHLSDKLVAIPVYGGESISAQEIHQRAS